MPAQTPQNYSRRAGSGMPGRVRRSIDGNVESMQRNGNTVEIAPTGKLEVRVRPGGGLKMTKDGLTVDQEQVGEKNRPQLARIQEPALGATAADLRTVVVALFDELRRTGTMRG